MSAIDDAYLIVTPNGYDTSKLYALKPYDGSGDLTWVRNTTSTRVNSSGLVEVVSNNVPRLDYTDVSCPCVLVEPQRTNLLTYSEQFDNAVWIKFGGQIISQDSTVSPDGTSNADKFTISGVFTGVYNTSYNLTADTYYSSSLFIKKDTATSFNYNYVDYFDGVTYFGWVVEYTFSNGNITITQNTSNTVTAEAIDFGNGWIRLMISYKSDVLKNYDYSEFRFVGGLGWCWGAQLETGSTASSYIPTTSGAVTRNSDVGTVTTPVGVTSIIETFEDGTTNSVSPIPVTYQMSEGRIAKVVMS